MATFSSKRIFYQAASLTDETSKAITSNFKADGFTVTESSTLSGGWVISVAKGGMFKAVLGMKTGLNITVIPIEGSLEVEAGVGIYGQQAIPTAVSMLLFWPVMLSQIWGMIQQAKLDDKVMDIAQSVVSNSQPSTCHTSNTGQVLYCSTCGSKISSEMKFCSHCGAKL